MSRAYQPRPEVAVLVRQVALACGNAGLNENVDLDLVSAILEEAARFAHAELEPLNGQEHEASPVIVDGRVRLAPQYIATWEGFAEGGWLGLDTPEQAGGQGLPVILAVAAQELFDRSCPAFGMMGVPIRSAIRLIDAFADAPTRAEWLPPLLSGKWGATICISEVGAGSDVARIRARARPAGSGWRVTGEKNWISFGDHDATARIGHFVLAHTDAGLSLFLVPSTWNAGDNGVAVRRLEEKVGLHLSPTCALGFENARGILLGQEGRGLAQMFVMITNMRLNVGAMGLGIAAGACDVARRYAAARLQGGKDSVPVAIETHQDIRRQIMTMSARVEMTRGLLYRTAVHADRARKQNDKASAAIVEWLLPIVKTLGGETGFTVASQAIQVLGGAGYTRDWPVEQSMRDARVLTIFEGTTGIQALDLVHRRLMRDEGETLALVVNMSRQSLSRCPTELQGNASVVFDLLEKTGTIMLSGCVNRAAVDAGATEFLALATEAALTWVAVELASIDGDDLPSRHLRGVAVTWLTGARRRAALHAAAFAEGAGETAAFGQLIPLS